jgi:hypothetical protein
VAVHAIGNAGLDAALNAFATAIRRHPGADHRFRVEHACHHGATGRCPGGADCTLLALAP